MGNLLWIGTSAFGRFAKPCLWMVGREVTCTWFPARKKSQELQHYFTGSSGKSVIKLFKLGHALLWARSVFVSECPPAGGAYVYFTRSTLGPKYVYQHEQAKRVVNQVFKKKSSPVKVKFSESQVHRKSSPVKVKSTESAFPGV